MFDYWSRRSLCLSLRSSGYEIEKSTLELPLSTEFGKERNIFQTIHNEECLIIDQDVHCVLAYGHQDMKSRNQLWNCPWVHIHSWIVILLKKWLHKRIYASDATILTNSKMVKQVHNFFVFCGRNSQWLWVLPNKNGGQVTQEGRERDFYFYCIFILFSFLSTTTHTSAVLCWKHTFSSISRSPAASGWCFRPVVVVVVWCLSSSVTKKKDIFLPLVSFYTSNDVLFCVVKGQKQQQRVKKTRILRNIRL